MSNEEHQWAKVGIGVLDVSVCMLAEFMQCKPEDVSVIGSIEALDWFSPMVGLLVEGPSIPTIQDSSGRIPRLDCTVTKLVDGSLEWDFSKSDREPYRFATPSFAMAHSPDDPGGITS